MTRNERHLGDHVPFLVVLWVRDTGYHKRTRNERPWSNPGLFCYPTPVDNGKLSGVKTSWRLDFRRA